MKEKTYTKNLNGKKAILNVANYIYDKYGYKAVATLVVNSEDKELFVDGVCVKNTKLQNLLLRVYNCYQSLCSNVCSVKASNLREFKGINVYECFPFKCVADKDKGKCVFSTVTVPEYVLNMLGGCKQDKSLGALGRVKTKELCRYLDEKGYNYFSLSSNNGETFMYSLSKLYYGKVPSKVIYMNKGGGTLTNWFYSVQSTLNKVNIPIRGVNIFNFKMGSTEASYNGIPSVFYCKREDSNELDVIIV